MTGLKNGTSSCAPAFLVAAAGSNSGKTSIALGLIRALVNRGLTVQPFKCGPDYLDPTHLGLAAGRHCYNLDPWMMGESYTRELFETHRATADIAVVEGAMGLYDGITPDSSQGSAVHVAKLLGIPLVLILDASGMGRTAAAVVHGCLSFEPNVSCIGVIGNRLGSDAHAQLIDQALAQAGLPRWIGHFTKNELPQLPSRHLGLIPANSMSAIDGDKANTQNDSIDDIARICAQRIHLSMFTKTIPNEPPPPSPSTATAAVKGNAVIAVAKDAAFQFVYEDNLAALRNAGAHITFFSPLNDAGVPDAHAIYLPGGYPELHAKALSENTSMRRSITAFHAQNKVIYGECGGLMYLSESIEDKSGDTWPMVGILPARVRMNNRLRSLGYGEVTLTKECVLGKAGSVLRGHRFHYSEITDDRVAQAPWEQAYSVFYPGKNTTFPEGYSLANTLASYIHIHWASSIDAATQFVRHCRRYA